MQRNAFSWVVALAVLVVSGCGTAEPLENANRQPSAIESVDSISAAEGVTSPDKNVSFKTTGELAAPVRLQADGVPIDIGKLSRYAHAGPWVADVDNDGDRDLLVGDFPGHFWFFENVNSDGAPEYESRGKLQAGGEAAKTPIY